MGEILLSQRKIDKTNRQSSEFLLHPCKQTQSFQTMWLHGQKKTIIDTVSVHFPVISRGKMPAQSQKLLLTPAVTESVQLNLLARKARSVCMED